MSDRMMIAVDSERLDRIEAAIADLRNAVIQPRVERLPEWMPLNDYADHMGVSARTVRNWMDKGKIETSRSGSKVMVRVSV